MAEHAAESRLIATFHLVNDWLKYAELKNGALVTLNAVVVMALHQLMNWYSWTNAVAVGWLWLATTCLAAGILVCLASFYSQTKTFAFDLPRRNVDGATNAIYFGHLANMSREEVLKRLVPGYDTSKPDAYLEDMADQIIINAKISSRKFSLFNLALQLTLIGVLTPFGWLLYYWRFCDERL